MSMAKAEKNHGFMNSPPSYSPINTVKNQQLGMRKEDAYEEPSSAPSGCYCFGFRLNRSRDERYLLNHHQQTQRTQRSKESSWVAERFNKLKEYSEVIAGPNWKNFVRKVGKYLNRKKQRTAESEETATTTNWMYSPNSYAMNFDKGNDYEDEDNYLCSFSSRYSVAHPQPHPPSHRNNDDGNSEVPTVKAVVL